YCWNRMRGIDGRDLHGPRESESVGGGRRASGRAIDDDFGSGEFSGVRERDRRFYVDAEHAESGGAVWDAVQARADRQGGFFAAAVCVAFGGRGFPGAFGDYFDGSFAAFARIGEREKAVWR